jgi:ClpX C4-type zinc finger
MAGPELHCTFCGKSADEVRQLIVGPSVYICNECLQIMRELFDAALQVKHSGVLFAPWKWSGGNIKVPLPLERAKITPPQLASFVFASVTCWRYPGLLWKLRLCRLLEDARARSAP